MKTQEKVIKMTDDRKFESRVMTLLKIYLNNKNEKNFRKLYQFLEEGFFDISDKAMGVISKKFVELSGKDMNLWNLAWSFDMMNIVMERR